MKKLVIDTKILETWLKAKIELHSGKVTEKELRQIRQWQQHNPCQYCTVFLTERTDDEDGYPCVKCGITDANEESERAR
jgi:coenzyme F420-reducing hydrogenase beta subunit